MLANSQGAITNNDKEDLTTFVAIPVDSLKNPTDHSLKLIQNIVVKQLPDGTICLTEAIEEKQNEVRESYQATESVPLKLIGDVSAPTSGRNRTILLHPPARKPAQDKSVLKNQPLKPKLGPQTYLCIKCDQSFATITQYHNHLKWHKCQKKFKCDKCALGYNVENNLKIHMVLMHSEERSTTCPVCNIGLTFQRAAGLKSHLMLHQVEELYTCDECEAEFENEDDFIKHSETHVSKKAVNSKPLTCSYCKLEFKETREFRAHISDHIKLRKTLLRSKKPRRAGGKKQESRHMCFLCKKSFIKNSLLERHMRIHSGEKPFECQFCDRSFTQKGTLQIHLSRHTGVKPYACTLCSARFNQKGNLLVHVKKTHTFPNEKDQKMYKCSQCTCIFKKIATLNGHVTKAHLNTKDSSRLDDGLIADVMSKLKELEKHALGIDTSKSVEKNKENEPKEIVVIENKTVEVPEFEKRNFINLTESANDGTVKKYLVRQKKVGDVRWYFCNYCSKQFKKPSDLIRHTRVHTKEKPFKCEQCNSEFTLKSTLISHAKTHSKMNYSCKVCDSSFASLRVLNAHLRKHEFESLPKWQCITCGFLFDELEQGIKHRENMGRENPHVVQPFINHILKQPLYQTAYGSLAFKPPKTHVPNTGSESPTLRPFHCTTCDARFTRRINLKRHIQFHNGDRNFKCTLCPKTFITSYRLKEHMNFHNNIKNYSCKQCDKKFVTSTLLKRHLIIHNSHKPYQCPYCAKTFKTLLLCRSHISKVHKKEVISKLNLEQRSLLRTEPDTGQGQDATIEVLPDAANVVLQDLPRHSNNEDIVIEQLLQDNGNCIQILNSDAASAALNNYPTIYINMNNMQLVDTSNLNLGVATESQNSGAALMDQQENMQVNDIIFNIDQFKPGLSLPPEEIFETTRSEDEIPTTLPSITEISSKPIKLNGFPEELVQEKQMNVTSLLNNSNMYGNISLNNYLSLPISIEDSSTIFDSTIPNDSCHPAGAPDLNPADEIYDSTNIMCINCSRIFLSLEDFQAHSCDCTETAVEDDQTVKNLTPDCDKERKKEEDDVDEKGKLECDVCNKMFSHKVSFDRHVATHSTKSSITCSVCKTVVNGRRQYLKHMATHEGSNGNSLRSCRFCCKEFKKPSDLKRHLRIHTGEKPFGCHLCGKTFSLKSTLESHIKTHDPTPKQYSCNVCNSFFSSKSSLKVHMTLHTGQRPYACSYCEQKFRTVSNRKSHEALMHIAKSKKSNKSKHTKVRNMLESVAAEIIDGYAENQQGQNGFGYDSMNVPNAEKIVSEVTIPPDNPESATENLLATLQDDQIPIDPVLLLQQLQMSGLILTNENNEPVSTLLLDDGTILNVDAAKDNVPELSLRPLEAQDMVNVDDPPTVEKIEKVRNMECDICHKMYASKDVLRKHRKKVHGVNKKYPCIKCDRAFDTQDELSKHNKWHAGYKAFSCVYCANSFMDESGLKIHMKRIHQHSNATKTTTSALLDVNFDLPSESIDDPLLQNLFTLKKIV